MPTSTFNFTSAVLDPRITFTRALNTATCVNSSGYVASVVANTPRFDYDPVTKIIKGLLIEETRTNILAYSEQFNDVTWLKINTSISSNAAVAPDNVLSADRLTENTATALHYLANAATLSVQPYTLSIFAKVDASPAVKPLTPVSAI